MDQGNSCMYTPQRANQPCDSTYCIGEGKGDGKREEVEGRSVRRGS